MRGGEVVEGGDTRGASKVVEFSTARSTPLPSDQDLTHPLTLGRTWTRDLAVERLVCTELPDALGRPDRTLQVFLNPVNWRPERCATEEFRINNLHSFAFRTLLPSSVWEVKEFRLLLLLYLSPEKMSLLSIIMIIKPLLLVPPFRLFSSKEALFSLMLRCKFIDILLFSNLPI